jgi:DedD protein
MATTTQDDSFREIQLSGKQLVFLFMAIVVILVGTFLMGLQVGRGVLAARGAPGAESTTADSGAEPAPPPPSASQGSSTSPATAGEKLSYAERLGSSEPAPEQLKKPAPAALSETPTPRSEPVSPAAAAPSSAAPATAAASTEPAGTGFAIQVAALTDRAEADTIVKRLAGKGYPAYLVLPAKGTPTVYRVRVGKFKDRREADTVSARLQKEEQFKPWVVR